MLTHLRATLWLLFLTAALCCVAYPLVLWGIGRTVFSHQAEGSLLPEAGGSQLIAQPFKDKKYFQPRPSSAGSSGYDASASSGSNMAASNPLLRDRVARQLGTLAKYKGGRLVGDDIETWFEVQPKGFAVNWAKAHPLLAKQWVSDNSEAVAHWLEKEEKAVKDDPEAAANEFFASYTQKAEPGETDTATWPTVDTQIVDGKEVKRIKPERKGDDVRAYLFESWLQDPKNKESVAKVVKIPADLIMASGSGLDPHITLDSALYQIDRVAPAWVEKTGVKEKAVREEIEKLLRDNAKSPLGGLAGVSLVNVLEINRELEPCVKRAGAKDR